MDRLNHIQHGPAIIKSTITDYSDRFLAERIAAYLWRLRRVYSIEAEILVWESLTIEHGSALEETKEYKEAIFPLIGKLKRD